MIPAYKEDVIITLVEKKQEVQHLEQRVQQLEERVRQMYETVQSMERERSRLKGDMDTFKHQLNKK